MLFNLEKCTEELCHMLGIPESLAERSYTNPVGFPIVYNIPERIALIAYPFDHATYPDRSFRLCINGRCLNVWENAPSQQVPSTSIEVFVSEATEDFDDEFLKTVAYQTFAVFYKAKECPYQISVKGRKAPPKPPRSPQKVITSLNKLVETMPEGSFELAVDLFVPVCVMPDELNAFIAYGKQTSWAELCGEARELVELALQKMGSGENGGPSGDSVA